MSEITLVIPARNAARTLRACLDSVAPLRASGELAEIILVDDGSTDATPAIAREYPVRWVEGGGGGPGAARNVGWRAARTPLVWFIDSDCVAEPRALERLRRHLAASRVAGAGGSYGNMSPDSLLASLIHEEIAERHARMGRTVDFLGSFNVLYRRDALAAVGGFDERRFNGPLSPGAEDAELAYRLHDAGLELRFEPESRVGHYHPTMLGRYLRAQRKHGYWRVNLYLRHPRRGRGDSYSGLADHAAPLVAAASVLALPALVQPAARVVPIALLAVLALLQTPMTLRLLRRTRRPLFALFAPLGMVRSVWRAAGMSHAVLAALHAGARRTATGLRGARRARTAA